MTRTIPQKKDSANRPDPNSPWLCEVSPKHAIWDDRKTKAHATADIYLTAPDMTRVGERVRQCSQILTLTEIIETGTGETGYKARATRCRVPSCPICSPLRAAKLRREIEPALIRTAEAHPSGRWLFLTLTVKNPPITELRQTVRHMSESWHRFVKRKELACVRGWTRSLEITRGAWVDIRTGNEIDKRKLYAVPEQFRQPKDPTIAHPHYHCLLFVPSYYFKTAAYIKHERWVQLWREAARLDYDPSVNVKTAKTLEGGLDEVIKAQNYSIGEFEIQHDPAWFLEYHRQCHGLRFFAAGGLVKEFLKADATEDEDMAGADDGQKETGKKISFEYFRPARKYKRFALRPVS